MFVGADLVADNKVGHLRNMWSDLVFLLTRWPTRLFVCHLLNLGRSTFISRQAGAGGITQKNSQSSSICLIGQSGSLPPYVVQQHKCLSSKNTQPDLELHCYFIVVCHWHLYGSHPAQVPLPPWVYRWSLWHPSAPPRHNPSPCSPSLSLNPQPARPANTQLGPLDQPIIPVTTFSKWHICCVVK